MSIITFLSTFRNVLLYFLHLQSKYPGEGDDTHTHTECRVSILVVLVWCELSQGGNQNAAGLSRFPSLKSVWNQKVKESKSTVVSFCLFHPLFSSSLSSVLPIVSSLNLFFSFRSDSPLDFDLMSTFSLSSFLSFSVVLSPSSAAQLMSKPWSEAGLSSLFGCCSSS